MTQKINDTEKIIIHCMHTSSFSLYNSNGQRKYLNGEERQRFLACTMRVEPARKLFCQLLFFTGARIREVYNLKPSSIDFSNRTVIIKTLKRRSKVVYREIPLPECLLSELQFFIEHELQSNPERLWSFSIRTASRFIKRVMIDSQINGVQSSAKGLRHGFAVHAISRVPITLVKKWLGHSRLESTEIYLSVIGKEERAIAQRLWQD